MTRRDRPMVALLAVTHAMVHVLEQAFPALLAVLMAQFAFTLKTGGYLAFGLALAFGAGAIPAGMLAQRWGARQVVQLYLLIAGAGAAVMAFAPTTPVLALGLVLIGAGISLYHPAGTSYVATHADARSQALGYHGVGGGFGVYVGPALAVTLAALLGWRGAFGAYAVVAIALIALIHRLPDRAPRPEAPPHADAPVESAGHDQPTRLHVLLFAAVLVGFIYRGVLTFLPLYLGIQLAGNSSPQHAAAIGGYVATGALSIGMVAQWLGGQLGARFSPTALFALGHIATVPCLLLLGHAHGGLLVAAAVAFAFCHFFGQPLGNLLVADFTSARRRDRAFGLYFAFAFGLGAFASGVGGEVGARYSIATIFVMLAGVAATAATAACWLHFAPRLRPATVVQPAET